MTIIDKIERAGNSVTRSFETFQTKGRILVPYEKVFIVFIVYPKQI